MKQFKCPECGNRSLILDLHYVDTIEEAVWEDGVIHWKTAHVDYENCEYGETACNDCGMIFARGFITDGDLEDILAEAGALVEDE